MDDEHQFTPEELAYYRAVFLSPKPELSPASLARWTEVQIALTAGEPADVEEAWATSGPAHFRVPMSMFDVTVAVVPFIPYPLAVLLEDGHLLVSEQTYDLLDSGLGGTTMREMWEVGPGVHTVDEDAHVASIVDAMMWRAQYPLHLDLDDIPEPPPTVVYEEEPVQPRPPRPKAAVKRLTANSERAKKAKAEARAKAKGKRAKPQPPL